MASHKHLLSLAVAAACCIGIAAPAFADSTARVSNNISIYAGPGTSYGKIGGLAAGERVYLNYCQPRDNFSWCELQEGGWVMGSYLVGAAAKLQATPARSLSTLNPFLPNGKRRFERDSWDD